MYQNNENPCEKNYEECSYGIPQTTATLMTATVTAPDYRDPIQVFHGFVTSQYSSPRFAFAVGHEWSARGFAERSDLMHYIAHINVTHEGIYALAAAALDDYKKIYATEQRQLVICTFKSDRWLHVHFLLTKSDGDTSDGGHMYMFAKCLTMYGIPSLLNPQADPLEK